LKKEIKLTIEISEELELFTDKHAFNTILRNLVSNAVKFTPRGGAVSILATRKEDKSVHVEVSDTGIGMNPKTIERMFTPGRQINRKGTEGEPSTGLGLVICKEFVEKMGGKITVESVEGIGSRVSLLFSVPDNAPLGEGKPITK